MTIWLAAVCSVSATALPGTSYAAASDADTEKASADIDMLLQHLDAGDTASAKQDFAAVKKWWTADKNDAKSRSLDLAMEIDGQIAAISLALLGENLDEAKAQAGNLRFSVTNLKDGAYTDNNGKSQLTLSTYILKLRSAADLAKNGKWDDARNEVKVLQQQWLTVEGDVVSQSQSVYNDSERDLVLLDGYLSDPNKREQAGPIFDRMIDSLAPLADAHYSWWDAALIPIREGIEALLVIGALLMYAKKADSKPARRWVVGGSALGLATCVAVGSVVALALSSAAFGRNNMLINGWTGVLASVLLLYVSYWLHRNSDAKRWSRYLASKSSQALSGGRMFSLGLLAFFAIVREGLETVIFLIGMAGKMPGAQLAAGIATGFGILVAAALVIVKAGSRLPIRPVFLVSSLIVFYLCFKFMGTGIHSLQMAGVLPATIQDGLPDFASLSLYPSWYSTLPQLLFLAAGIAAVIVSIWTGKRQRPVSHS
ncbi:FTR1 family iron permease [Cohnella zeiphila]|uniref:FTR1 family protein n=1 Tax=Cohnella zeiphila TaxID=2761120 RepID=A0A7X0SSP3_9BACL|nr:FTR1 family protein [Cohnella zeiphila]MBB6735391.1 FTR1 family protein [Cohnella zeiphila]